jgi:DNA modification methylase
MLKSFAFDYDSHAIGNSVLVHADCFEWMSRIVEDSIHAIVTDPPYGVKEYHLDQLRLLPKALSNFVKRGRVNRSQCNHAHQIQVSS